MPADFSTRHKRRGVPLLGKSAVAPGEIFKSATPPWKFQFIFFLYEVIFASLYGGLRRKPDR